MGKAEVVMVQASAEMVGMMEASRGCQVVCVEMEEVWVVWVVKMGLEAMRAEEVANGDSVARLEELEAVGWALGAAEE